MTKKFTDLHGPKHEGLEAFGKALEDLRATPDFRGLFSGTAEPLPRPRTLLEFYLGNDLRQLLQDVRARPEHYSERQREIVEHLCGTGGAVEPPTDQEKDELLLHFTRSTEAEAKSRDLIREMTAARHRKEDKENEETIMEDGRSLKDHLESDPTYETQSFGDKIIV